MAEWQMQDLRAYRDRLLQAGVPYRKVRRHLLELRDHRQELLLEAGKRGLEGNAASAWAEAQLGSLSEIGDHMLLQANQRSLWYRYPALMTLLLPISLYALSVTAVVLVMIGSGELARISKGSTDLIADAPGWLFVLFELLRAFLLYVVTPLLSLMLIRQQVRQMVPLGYIVAGGLVLCILGSSAHVSLVWPDPVTQTQGSVGASILYGWVQANTLRLLASLSLSALGWYWWRRQRDLLPQ